MGFFSAKYVYIDKSKKKYSENYFYPNISYPKDFFRKLGLFNLIFYFKACKNYFKYFESKTINYLSSDIGF